jgi:hypothetical protein
MSPEHILGVPDIDARADVYGFGLLLYESLTGQMAFPEEPGPVLFDCVLHEPAVPVTVVRPDLPAGLVRIIEKAMGKDRDQRYSDVNLLVMALEDELTPPTPAPLLLTPQAGVPSFIVRDPRSRPHAPEVRAVLNQEPSGQHQGTRNLFAFSLQTEGKEDAALAGPNGGNAGSKAGSEEAASLPTTDRKPALVDLRVPLGKTRSRGLGARSAFRGRGGLVGAGLALAIGFFGVSVAMRGPRPVRTGGPTPVAKGTPPAREPMVQPAFPAVVSSATVEPVAVPVPSTISASPPVPGAPATRERSYPVRKVRVMPVPVTARLVVAVRETSNEVPPREHALRGASGRDRPAHAPSSAQRAGASAKSPAPRAGPLSKDDF